MNIAPLADIKAHFSAYIRKIQDGPVIVTKHEKPVAILLSVSNEDDLERVLLANSTKFQALLDAAEVRIRDTGGMIHEDIWAIIEAKA